LYSRQYFYDEGRLLGTAFFGIGLLLGLPRLLDLLADVPGPVLLDVEEDFVTQLSE
jgi:hypothetical protein